MRDLYKLNKNKSKCEKSLMEDTAPNPKPCPRGPRRGGAELLKHHCPSL